MDRPARHRRTEHPDRLPNLAILGGESGNAGCIPAIFWMPNLGRGQRLSDVTHTVRSGSPFAAATDAADTAAGKGVTPR